MIINRLEFRPLTPKTWGDFEQLFGQSGAYGGCWCMYWRLTRREFESNKNPGNKKAMKDLIWSGTVPGILAYDEGAPVGWCAVAPRSELGTLNRSHVLKRIDDHPVWSITCFFVAKSHRDRGMLEDLIHGAIDHVKTRGGSTVEAYPHSPVENKMAPVSTFMGFPAAFERVGFRLCREASKAKWIMRYDIEDHA